MLLYRQVEICKWNLKKLSEALSYLVDQQKLENILETKYNKSFSIYYKQLIAFKLGLFEATEEVNVLINDLFDLLEDFGFDISMFFRSLGNLDIKAYKKPDESLVNYMLKNSFSYSEKTKKLKPQIGEGSIETLMSMAKCK